MSVPDSRLPQRPRIRSQSRTVVVWAVVVGPSALDLHGTAAAQAPAQARQQEQSLGQTPQPAGLYLPAVVCRPAADEAGLCSRGPGSQETGYPELQAEVAARFSYPELPDAEQRQTEWRRQCGITSEEDTWP